MSAQRGPKLNYQKTFLLGFGFFSISMAWSLFNSYVPIFLRSFISSSFLVGLVMILDNLAGLTLQPYFSGLSDRVWTRYGRRMPFLVAGIPLAAVGIIFLPLSTTLGTLIISVLLVDFSMSLFRGPTVALMPDLTPSSLRSQANGIINFMGGAGAAVALFLGAKLYDMNRVYPFALTAILMVIILFLLLRVIREPREGQSVERVGIAKELRQLVRTKKTDTLLLLGAIFLWFLGWSGTEAFFTTYGKFGLGMKESTAAFILGFFAIGFLLFTIPSGYIAARFGRRRTILTGICGMVALFISLFFVKAVGLMGALLFVGGLFWALINVNSYPMVVEMAGVGKIGAYTGLYYFASSFAAVIAPPIYGSLMDLVGYSVIFVLAMSSMILALLFMLRVHGGEADRPDNQVGDAGATAGAGDSSKDSPV